MKVYVIRHGITELNKKKIVNGQIDEPLAPEGIKQAQATIPLIPDSVTHIYHSSLQRAKQTAEIINSKLNHFISSHHELREIHMGSLAGKSWKEMKSGQNLKIKHRSVQFDYQTYGGESVKDVKKRLTKFLTRIKNKHNDYQALIVTHGGILRVLHLLEHNKPLLDELDHATIVTVNLDKLKIPPRR